MRIIWKYPLLPDPDQTIQMPSSAKILCVHTQGEHAFLWAEVETASFPAFRRFRVYRTGEAMIEAPGCDERYVGTFHLAGGSLAFHVYEVFPV